MTSTSGLIHYQHRSNLQGRAKWDVPSDNHGSENACPYCATPVTVPSRDHIFPQFLGGRRWIWCCTPCNSKFGHTIEATAEAEIFTPNYVFLSLLGLSHARDGAKWRNAFKVGDVAYHLVADGAKVRVDLAKPIITKDQRGRIVEAKFSNKAQADAFVVRASAKGQRLKSVQEVATNFPAVMCGFDMGPKLVRPALKMCLAAAALLGVDQIRTTDARVSLVAPPESPVPRCGVVSVDYADIYEFGGPLSHIIYVESGPERVYGVVQFLGVLQVYCELSRVPSTQERNAIVGVLDPLKGKDRFEYTTPLNLPIGFGNILPPEAESLESLSQWVTSRLAEQIVARGGKDVGLQVAKVEGQ